MEAARSTTITLDMRHAILMIARALDYVGIDDLDHGHRVGYIAHECAKRLGWTKEQQYFVLLAGLLHDCGVSSTREHENLLAEMMPEVASRHCLRGWHYAKASSLMAPFADIILYHHTPWSELQTLDIDPWTRECAALILLADRVDFLRAGSISSIHPETVILAKHVIAETITGHAGTLFKPDLTKAMAELMDIDGFWFQMDHVHIENLVMEGSPGHMTEHVIDLGEVDGLARIMAQIVDAKSPFTRAHSILVADVSKALAKELGWDNELASQLHIAGLLHDVGKLKTPDEILHKGGKLDAGEYSLIKRHVVDTGWTLHTCFPNSPIPHWAANHHERIDGSGYPFRLKGEDLDQGSRIIAIADIFQALAQDRPYRERLTFDEIMEIMQPQVDDGKLDADILAILRSNSDLFYDIATSTPIDLIPVDVPLA